jgi:ribose transport system ATP-binding protein
VYVDPKMIVRKLTIAQQEMIVIGKMMNQKAKVIIFDEPTALLTNEETAELFRIVRLLKKQQNIGIIYISHRLEEIFELCDCVTVLKDGKTVGTKDIKEIDQDRLIAMMVGRDLTNMYNIGRGQEGETVLKVEKLTRKGKFENINFEVRRGQILGMFGLIGSGRTDIVRSIFGADPYDSGIVSINGQVIVNKTPKQGIGRGMALIPEDRKKEGLCMLMSIKDNACMACNERFSKVGFINHGKVKKIAKGYVDKLGIKTPSLFQRVNKLSGGNQQKVVIAKWLANDCDIFVLDEPTVGVDVGSKQEIYKLLEEFVAENKVIIIISSYLPEIMGLADRILVMHEGKQMGIVDRNQFSEEKLLALASGLKESNISNT